MHGEVRKVEILGKFGFLELSEQELLFVDPPQPLKRRVPLDTTKIGDAILAFDVMTVGGGSSFTPMVLRCIQVLRVYSGKRELKSSYGPRNS